MRQNSAKSGQWGDWKRTLNLELTGAAPLYGVATKGGEVEPHVRLLLQGATQPNRLRRHTRYR